MIFIMTKAVKIILLTFLWFFIGINAFPQYYVKVKGDSIRFEVDSVALAIESETGDIAWEVSKDSLTWTSLDQYDDSLIIRIDSCAYYRAILTDGTCYPVNSAVALVAFRSIEVTGNTVVIDTIGGIYTLPSGVKLFVPPGAVGENVTVSIELLDNANADLRIPFNVDTGKVYSTGIYCEPALTSFLKPVRIRVPALNYQHVDLPFVYLYNSLSNTWFQNTRTLICSEGEQFIEFSTDVLLPARIELIKNAFEVNKSSSLGKGDVIDCHQLLVEIRNKVQDYVGRRAIGECFAIKDELTVTFTQCPGNNVQTVNFREIGKDCIPKIEHSITKSCLAIGESAVMTFKVTIGPSPDNSIPLENQTIFISVPDGMTITDPEPKTDKFGIASVTVTRATENGLGKIDYILLANYYLSEISASAGGATEYSPSFPKSAQAKGTPQIISDADCGQVYYVEIHSDQETDGDGEKRGETYHLTCDCYDSYRAKVDCGKVVYSIASYYPSEGAVSVDPSSGVVTCNKPGVAEIKATASGVVSTYNAFFTVAYEGDLILNGVTDHNTFYVCGCREDYDATGKWRWYTVSWSVKLHFYFWLSKLDEAPFGDVEGENRYVYTINDSRCNNATFIEPVDGFDFSWSGWTFSSIATHQAIFGEEFSVSYAYFDYQGWGYRQDIGLDLKMIEGGFNAHVRYFYPHGCVLQLYPGDFLLK